MVGAGARFGRGRGAPGHHFGCMYLPVHGVLEYHYSMQRDTLRIVLLYVLGALAVVVPISTAGWLAEHESHLREQDSAAAMAGELLRRTDKITEQLRSAFAELRKSSQAEHCTDQQIGLMRAQVIRSNLLLDIGYQQGDALICSSFGRDRVPLGPITYTGANGAIVRVGVHHPLAPDSPLIVVTDPKSDYAALVSQALLIDSVPNDGSVTAGMIGVKSRRILAERGTFNPEWLRTIADAYELTFYDGTNVVAWRRSAQTDYAAFAAIGPRRIQQHQREIFLLLMPMGLAAAAVLCFVMMRLARFRASMPSLLKSALKGRREFFLVYQPIVELGSGEWRGVEALLRWRRPSGELISPDVFIPIAERNHLMEAVTRLLLETVEKEAGVLLRARPELHIALNLSAEDFCCPDIVERLNAMIQRMQIRPGNLQLEATERVFMNIEASRRNLQQLRALGIHVAIDDFGTGYSSLSYLHSLEADLLKIDKAFVGPIGTGAVTSEVVRHIIEMARSLNMTMVAEGVETVAQADYLRTQGVQYGQGWLFARPMGMGQVLRELGLGEGADLERSGVFGARVERPDEA